MISRELSDFTHVPVLYEQTLEALRVCPTGIYVDCTTGGAGHSAGVLSKLSTGGLLICLDKDDEALRAADVRLSAIRSDGAFRLIKSDFGELARVLADLRISAVDGIMADLGVSSHQLDTGERGFSYNHDGPLDMRMDQSRELTAAELINTWPEEEIARVLKDFGEERHSARLARAIVTRRARQPFETTGELSDLLCAAMPGKSKKEKQHPAKRSFQALRIAVNGELDSLTSLLDCAPDCLAPGGRLAIISFHSLEDRLVKTAYRDWEHPCVCPPGLPCVCGQKPLGRIVGPRKGMVADEREMERNTRARSARLRIFERGSEWSAGDDRSKG
ncbi:MAG: 16S rRNA (cytosine(1402)-N(4))-methyltransferase RsmH [Fastidiosipilaceae bacterium]|jgi:16S rRNA (cytosine1402-N4)-methyltransferase